MSNAKRYFFTICGLLSLVIAIVGFVLPLLPGTPFLILSAMCFSKGSQRFHDWLLGHRWLGPPILDWQEHHAIATRHKAFATATVAISCAIFFTRPSLPVVAKAVYAVFITGLMVVLWTRKSR